MSRCNGSTRAGGRAFLEEAGRDLTQPDPRREVSTVTNHRPAGPSRELLCQRDRRRGNTRLGATGGSENTALLAAPEGFGGSGAGGSAKTRKGVTWLPYVTTYAEPSPVVQIPQKNFLAKGFSHGAIYCPLVSAPLVQGRASAPPSHTYPAVRSAGGWWR